MFALVNRTSQASLREAASMRGNRRAKIDEILFSPAVLALGRIHWMLLRSAEIMDKDRFVDSQGDSGLRVTHGFTDFGNEVALDEIHWWVFTQEQNRRELQDRTNTALHSADRLYEDAKKLRENKPESYEKLIVSLKDFADARSSEIDALLDYVNWLDTRDPRAPRILFTYRIWGSTRMADRSVKLPDQQVLTEDFQKLLSDIVLGVRGTFTRKIDEIHSELAYEMWDSVDPEYQSEIRVPESALIGRTAFEVYIDCAVYFEEIRRSLRNILLDVKTFENERDLTESDAFWREFIVKAAKWKGSETQVWDFKETLTMWHSKNEAKQDAKVEFAEDIAAFANTKGGVLVVGITDKTREIVGISGPRADLENRVKFASDVIVSLVERGDQITKLRQVAIEVNGERRIVIVVLVAQASGVIGVHNGTGQYTFPVRRETGKALVSKSDVAGGKTLIKSDNYDFLKNLATFVREN
jgi:Putative DNA-binding domain